MKLKTSDSRFLKFGQPFSSNDLFKENFLEKDTFVLKQAPINLVYAYSDEIVIKAIDGIVLICVSSSIEFDILHQFVIHGNIKLKKGVFFNFISLTPTATISISLKKFEEAKTFPLAEPFVYKPIKNDFLIDNIYASYYNVKGPNYQSLLDYHNYYELIYVDNGIVTINCDNKAFDLEKYGLCIVNRNSKHFQSNFQKQTCSFLTIMFDSEKSLPISLFNKKIITNAQQIELINQFSKYSEGTNLSRNNLLIFTLNSLIALLLENGQDNFHKKPINPINHRYENELLASIVKEINDNIFDVITIDDLCKHFSISRSTLQHIFKENLDISPKKYINKLKLQKSRLLIKEGKYNISEIATMLGYNSIHYFSRTFTANFNITPSAYAKSIIDKE